MAKDIKENKTAVYIRVSTEDQAREGHSLDEQLDRIKEFCNYKKLTIEKGYKDDGKSAKDMKGRPEFLKMVNDVKNGKVNNICIYKLDRLTRSVKYLEEILVLLEQYNCGLMSVSEDINTKGYMGVFFIRLTILLAQLEIDQTKERTIMGLIGTVKQGIPIGKLPLGYRRDINNSDLKLRKKAIICEEEAKTIRKIFNLYLKGYSYYFIAQKLIEEGNSQMKWKDWVIQQIINNRIYCGDIEHRKSIKDKETVIYEDVVPPIISKDVFNECQVLIEKNKHSFGGSLEYMFGKTLYCDKCGSMLCVSSNKDKGIKHYWCKKCNSRLNESKVEKAILEKLQSIEQFNIALTYNAIMVDNDRLTEILNNVELEAPDERLKERKEELRDLLDDAVYKANKEKSKSNNLLWVDMNYEEKRAFINTMIEAIYIDKVKGSNQQNYDIVIKRVRFKQSRIMAFYKLINQGIIDSISAKANVYYNSLALIDKEEDIKNYIDKLRKKYKIKVDEITIRGDEPKRKNSLKRMDDFFEEMFFNNDKLFKLIKVGRSNELLRGTFNKERHIFISLLV